MDSLKLEPCITLPLDDKTLIEIIDKAKDWAIMHGASMRSKLQFSKDTIQFAPFVLTPSTFPRAEFEKAVQLQPILNELIHRAAHDHEFLSQSLVTTFDGDPFTARLFQLYEEVRSEGVAQRISLGLLRCDLMLESLCCGKSETSRPYCCWKQVEINTIASGFGHLGPASAVLQRYVLEELGHGDKTKNLPANHALSGLCNAMLEAWKIAEDENAAILFIVEDVSYNICDQRFHEFEIRRLNPNVRVIRKTLTEVYNEGKLGSNKELLIGSTRVSVVYFRAGYEPAHYPTENEWSARSMIEKSRAIKCPSVQYHLAGTKKVQQSLAKPGILDRFLNDPNKVKAVSEIFTGLYSLDLDKFGDEAYKMALAEPERFVLKPQREGGGNNIYGSKIRDALMNMGKTPERAAWILMERITPPLSEGYIIRPGDRVPPPLVSLISELGIFGAILGDSENIIYNKQVGHMLRTKLSTADEGGVAAGLGALDSPYLIDI
ncbi:glutathione synthetase-like isoform X1 [Ctenocephalides felis]|uniref:glutathione synthetase-like isoform X1 n=1 Tax=Ctenocephalides felis TaxID=7515 RepID=UPI000E6E4D33|nr:glutathione synthetase-like isoform X1 [Ctenocephalides felis]